MIGAIAGDIIGSPYEGKPTRDERFPLFSSRSTFTDDTVLTIATAEALLDGYDYVSVYRRYGRKYPNAGYGGTFIHWIFDANAGPYNSWGNGSAMRVSPIGWAFDSLDETLAEAEASASVTHNHPEGIKGAQAVAASIFLARNGATKDDIRRDIARRFAYHLDRSATEIRKDYSFDVTCQGSVPEALVCFLDSDDLEHAIRLAVLLGGDADTQACVAGAVAEAFYGGVPQQIVNAVRERLPSQLLKTVDRFSALRQSSNPG